VDADLVGSGIEAQGFQRVSRSVAWHLTMLQRGSFSRGPQFDRGKHLGFTYIV
jgi:hypothetical protein